MKSRDQLYLNLLQAVEDLHTEGDNKQDRLAGKLSTLIHNHLEARGLRAEDIEGEYHPHTEKENCRKCFNRTEKKCPRNCGRNTVCGKCAKFEEKKCHRCGQKFWNEDDELDIDRPETIVDGLNNWLFNEQKNSSWDFRCLICGSVFQEKLDSSREKYGLRYTYLVPVDAQGEPIEMTEVMR